MDSPAEPPVLVSAPDPGDLSSPQNQLSVAAAMIANGDAAGARAVLDALVAGHPVLPAEAATEIEFLRAMIDLDAHLWRPAIARLRHLLVANPRAARIRLELARALYLAHDYQGADRQFRLARAGRVPDGVRANIDAFLGAIRQERRWDWSFSLAAVADSNRNSATGSDTVALFGLPFQLSPDARRSGGVGAVVDAAVEWTALPGHRWRWRSGVQLHRAQYGPAAFNDMGLAAYSGPRFAAGRWDLGLTAGLTRRWYGDHVFADAASAQGDVTYAVSPRIGLGLSLGVTRQRYAIDPVQNGPGGEAGLSVTWIPDPGSVIRFDGAALVQHAGDPGYANGGWRAGLAMSHDFPGGLSARIAPAYSRFGYDAVLDLFGERRIDHQWSLDASITHRGLVWRGLIPQLTVSRIDNRSTIALYHFSRTRIGIGVTRAF